MKEFLFWGSLPAPTNNCLQNKHLQPESHTDGSETTWWPSRRIPCRVSGRNIRPLVRLCLAGSWKTSWGGRDARRKRARKRGVPWVRWGSERAATPQTGPAI